jgi:PAS domain S-box-containing protein
MPDFDMKTVVLFSIFVDAIAFFVILSLWQQNRKRYPGLTHLAVGFFLQVVTMGLLGLRDDIPAFFSIVLGNMAMLVAFILVLTGIARFYGKRYRQLQNYILLAAVLGLQIYFTYYETNYGIRIILISSALFLLGIQGLWLVTDATLHSRLKSRQLVTAFSGMVVVSLVRLVLPAFMDFSSQTFFEPNNADAVLIALLQLFFLILTYNLVLLVNRRLYVEAVQREEALQESQLFNEGVLNSISNPVIVANLDTTIRYVNPAFEKITGYPSEEVVGRPSPYPWWPGKFINKYSRQDDAGRLIGESKVERNYQSKDGKTIHVVVNIRAIKEGETVKYFLASWDDITERKAAEDTIRGLYEDEKAARAELEEESKARGMFIDILAHELRTPLTPMLSSCDTLKEVLKGTADETSNQLLGIIYRSVQSMSERLEELLEVARYARGVFSLNTETVNLTEFLNDVISRFRPVPGDSGYQLITHIPESMSPGIIDRLRIEQVISNLLSNAVKYSPEESTIEFSANIEDSNLRIDVKDEGSGIPPAERKNLFKPYHRVTRDRIKPGLGLGLAVCKQIVDAHKGQIWIENRSRKGSTFSFSIPLVPEE